MACTLFSRIMYILTSLQLLWSSPSELSKSPSKPESHSSLFSFLGDSSELRWKGGCFCVPPKTWATGDCTNSISKPLTLCSTPEWLPSALYPESSSWDPGSAPYQLCGLVTLLNPWSSQQNADKISFHWKFQNQMGWLKDKQVLWKLPRTIYKQCDTFFPIPGAWAPSHQAPRDHVKKEQGSWLWPKTFLWLPLALPCCWYAGKLKKLLSMKFFFKDSTIEW